MIGLGPFSLRIIIIAGAALVGWLLVRTWAKRLPESPHRLASALFTDVLLVGLLAARPGYVLRWWPEYAA